MRWLPLLMTGALVALFVGVIALSEARIFSHQQSSVLGDVAQTETPPPDQTDVAGLESESSEQLTDSTATVNTNQSASASIDIDVDVSSDSLEGQAAPQGILEMTTDGGVQTITCDPGERYRSADGSIRCSNRNGDLNLRFNSSENTNVIRIKFSYP